MFMHPKLQEEAENIASAYVFFVVSNDNFSSRISQDHPADPQLFTHINAYFLPQQLEHGLAR
jgi:hypothetical protein